MKTYFATTVEAALDLARRELGSEALLVNSRPAPEEVRHLGFYEVVFATQAQTPGRPPAVGPNAGSPRTSRFRRLLEASGVEPMLARDLIYTTLRESPAIAGSASFSIALRCEMERRFRVDSNLRRGGDARTVIAFAGPPGRGKTTTLVKLAVNEGLARRIPVRILSLDNYRVGASEQLRSFAAILGVPFQLCDTVGQLDCELASSSGGLILIDTPGYSPSELSGRFETARYFAGHSQIRTQLVLRAEAKPADVVRTVRAYSNFGLDTLIFTGMDEVESVGSVFSSVVMSETPVSFLGTGQSIPEDIAPAARGQILASICQGWEEEIPAAA